MTKVREMLKLLKGSHKLIPTDGPVAVNMGKTTAYVNAADIRVVEANK